MTSYNDELHQIIDEFILDILVENCKWMWEQTGYKVIYRKMVCDSIAEIETINDVGTIRDWYIDHRNGVPQRYAVQYLRPEFEGWHFLDIVKGAGV